VLRTTAGNLRLRHQSRTRQTRPLKWVGVFTPWPCCARALWSLSCRAARALCPLSGQAARALRPLSGLAARALCPLSGQAARALWPLSCRAARALCPLSRQAAGTVGTLWTPLIHPVSENKKPSQLRPSPNERTCMGWHERHASLRRGSRGILRPEALNLEA
jgi:hypothetical protein